LQGQVVNLYAVDAILPLLVRQLHHHPLKKYRSRQIPAHPGSSPIRVYKMDRGAARSRKRAAQPAKVEARDSKDHKPSRLAARNVSDKPTTSEAGPSKPRQPRPVKAPREPQSRDPALYRPKAVRTAAALNWSQEPFTEPPSLTGITRVDLSGSEMTDVSWLKDSEVRWLSLAGCKITKGWEAVGSLKELTGEFKPSSLRADMTSTQH
jgi:hypothetical protein